MKKRLSNDQTLLDAYEKEKYDRTYSELAGSLTCLCSRKIEKWMVMGGGKNAKENMPCRTPTQTTLISTKRLTSYLSARKKRKREERRIES